MNRLTIFSVATNTYLDYWLNLVASSEIFLDKELSIQWIVFTNRAQEIPEITKKKLGKNLVVIEVRDTLWPMPTLLRYELLLSISEKIDGELVMHLDADMLFVGPVQKKDLTSAANKSEIVFIQHPGYFRPKSISKIYFYITNFSYIVRDFRLILLNGALGAWEKNPKSKAFVPRSHRRVYVCGATWFGKKDSIVTLCKLLSARVNSDLIEGFIARHNDESHLNWFAANHNVFTLKPELCFESSYPQLEGINAKILALDKGSAAAGIKK